MISEGETQIVDGTRGLLIVDPDPVVLAEYRALQAELKAERKRLRRPNSEHSAAIEIGSASTAQVWVGITERDAEHHRIEGACSINIRSDNFEKVDLHESPFVRKLVVSR
jgi:signal transduction protein with GAF and PtsI domain